MSGVCFLKLYFSASKISKRRSIPAAKPIPGTTLPPSLELNYHIFHHQEERPEHQENSM